MFDTPVTVIGNVLTTPEWRRTTNTGTTLVTFKVASTSRRYDKERAHWVDGDSLRVRVACWRKLGENVSLSIQLGDPVIVYGRLYSRDWTDDQGARRTSYELDAVAIGHDLARGVAKFARRRTAGGTDMVNDEANAAAIGGEVTEPIDTPGRPDGLPPDHELFEDFDAAIFEIADAESTPVDVAADGVTDVAADDTVQGTQGQGTQGQGAVAPAQEVLAGTGTGAGVGRRSRGAGRARAGDSTGGGA